MSVLIITSPGIWCLCCLDTKCKKKLIFFFAFTDTLSFFKKHKWWVHHVWMHLEAHRGQFYFSPKDRCAGFSGVRGLDVQCRIHSPTLVHICLEGRIVGIWQMQSVDVVKDQKAHILISWMLIGRKAGSNRKGSNSAVHHKEERLCPFSLLSVTRFHFTTKDQRKHKNEGSLCH